MPRTSLILVPLLLLAITAGGLHAYTRANPPPDRWKQDVLAIEARDRLYPPATDAVVFVGSSTIRLWDRLADDMAPIPTLNQGIGGARILDLFYYLDQLVIAYRPRVIVIYAGENELGSWWAWPGLAVNRMIQLAWAIKSALPNARILLLSIKPSPYFAARLAVQQQANEMLRVYCESGVDHRLAHASHAWERGPLARTAGGTPALPGGPNDDQGPNDAVRRLTASIRGNCFLKIA